MNIFQYILEIIFPNPLICPLCGSKENKPGICIKCQVKLKEYSQNKGQCQKCGTFGKRVNKCENCKNWPNYIKGNLAFIPYEGVYKKLLHSFKYKKQVWLAPYLAELMVKNLPELNEYDFILAVPIHRKRYNERGFNQSALLAKYLAKKMNHKYIDNVLVREKYTIQQTKLSRVERCNNLKDVFKVTRKSLIKDKKIILVDDVITTGTTLLECSKILYHNGAREITCITLAAGVV